MVHSTTLSHIQFKYACFLADTGCMDVAIPQTFSELSETAYESCTEKMHMLNKLSYKLTHLVICDISEH